jgi:hypothetical protein
LSTRDYILQPTIILLRVLLLLAITGSGEKQYGQQGKGLYKMCHSCCVVLFVVGVFTNSNQQSIFAVVNNVYKVGILLPPLLVFSTTTAKYTKYGRGKMYINTDVEALN